MTKAFSPIGLLFLAACANGSVQGTYLPRNGDDGRFIELADSHNAVIRAQGRLINTPYEIAGTRLRFTAFGPSADGQIDGDCIDFATITYCRRHFVRIADDTASRTP